MGLLCSLYSQLSSSQDFQTVTSIDLKWSLTSADNYKNVVHTKADLQTKFEAHISLISSFFEVIMLTRILDFYI